LKDLFVPDVVTMIEESFVTEQASESECMTCSSNPSIAATAVVGWRCNTVTRNAKWNINNRLTILAGIISTL
jgi:hypothetical protein